MEHTISGNLHRTEHLVTSRLQHLSSQEKTELMKQILASEVINLKNLRRCASTGIPDSQGLRARTWMILLNYLPKMREKWSDLLAQRRREYASFCQDFAISPSEKDSNHTEDHPLSNEDDSMWNSYFKDRQFMEQIEIDVDRTQQGEPFFGGETEEAELHRTEMKRALFIHAKLNPGLKYVQGMNELLAPLYYVFKSDPAEPEDAAHAEADAFFCFIQLLEVSENRDLYCKALDKSQSGTRATLEQVMTNLAESDPTVAQHLRKHKIDPHYFAFRWIAVLFAQDIEVFADVLRVWDYLLGDEVGCKNAVMNLCSALILNMRTEILGSGFQEIVKLLQNTGKEDSFDVENVLSIAVCLNPRYIL